MPTLLNSLHYSIWPSSRFIALQCFIIAMSLILSVNSSARHSSLNKKIKRCPFQYRYIGADHQSVHGNAFSPDLSDLPEWHREAAGDILKALIERLDAPFKYIREAFRALIQNANNTFSSGNNGVKSGIAGGGFLPLYGVR